MNQPQHNDSRTINSSAPLGSTSGGQLVFTSGAAGVTIHADPALRELYQARFERHLPSIRVQNGRVVIQYRNVPFLNWLIYARTPLAAITLNGSVPWEIEIRGGVSTLTADLRNTQLRSLDVLGGASDVTMQLPRPTGAAFLHIAGGANNLTIHRPAGVALRLHVHQGLSNLVFDDRRSVSAGTESSWESPGFARATERYDISIGGGASNVTIGAR